ncbi:MAG TPA: ATP-grasp domain-containing protein [Candidatus Polarisedimenticolia bacterium]|nr:ATP-grasp domain-containing protein [Candidatus Polarisedimenticolia bacterium]
MNPPRLLLAGASVRALARSALAGAAARARFPGGILAVDYFGDHDLTVDPRVTPVAIARDLGLPRTTAGLGHALIRLATAGTTWDGLAWAGGLENRPALLRRLARRGPAGSAPLLGNRPEVVAAVRNTRLLFAALEAEHLRHPEMPGLDAAPRDGRRWLFKHRRCAGGRGVRMAAPGEPRRPGEDLQEWLEGVPCSVAFVADGRAARLLGATEQLPGVPGVAEAAENRFRYAGNIAGPLETLTAAERATLERAAGVVTGRFGLRGLNGLDYVLAPDGPAFLEVNPRFTASMEILEEMAGVSFFDLHLEAVDGRLPGPERSGSRGNPAGSASAWMGKRILYAEGAVEAPEPGVLEPLGVRDRPHRGERFEAGQPLCTLIVSASGREACRAALRAGEHEVRRLFRAPEGDRAPTAAPPSPPATA